MVLIHNKYNNCMIKDDNLEIVWITPFSSPYNFNSAACGLIQWCIMCADYNGQCLKSTLSCYSLQCFMYSITKLCMLSMFIEFMIDYTKPTQHNIGNLWYHIQYKWKINFSGRVKLAWLEENEIGENVMFHNFPFSM